MSKKSAGMERIERRLAEDEHLAKKAADARLKTLQEILADDEKPHEIYVPDLGIKIQAKELTFGAYPELVDEKDPFERVIKILLGTWGRADSSVTRETLLKLGLVKCTSIMTAITESKAIVPLVEQATSSLPTSPAATKAKQF